MNWSKEKQGKCCTYYEFSTTTMRVTLEKFTKTYMVRVTTESIGTIIKEDFDIDNFGDDEKAKQKCIKIVLDKLHSRRDYWNRLTNEIVLSENI